MRIKLKKIGIATFFITLFSVQPAFAKVYNPLVTQWLDEVDQILEEVQLNSTKEESEDQKCSKKEWSSFAKSFLSYGNFTGEWGDLMRNDCLREDLWQLEDKVSEISQFGLLEAKKCEENLVLLKNAYENLTHHIDGLRLYGEDSELEKNESTNCPSCKKAEIVGEENTYTQYYSKIYTEKGCELTREKSKKWKEEFEKLKESFNLFKNIKALWENGISDHSWEITSADYAAAQKSADGWWGRTWNAFYSYNGRQLNFRHLRDGEDSLIGATRMGELAKNAGQAMAEVLLPPTVADLVEIYPQQLEVYQALSYHKEQVILDEDLAEWKSKLDLKYGVSNSTEDDLENYLISLNNSIKILIDTKNPIIERYYKKLKNVAENHCRNLYGACKE